MSVAFLLAERIASLFLLLLAGLVIVRLGLAKPDDSRGMSVLVLYLLTPSATLSAFQIDFSWEIAQGFLFALVTAAVVQLGQIGLVRLLAKPLRLDEVERVSVVYSNSANLIIPLVVASFGQEWVIYSLAYVSVQLLLLWSHGKSVLTSQAGFDVRKVLTNINMIAIFVGILLFVTGLRLPGALRVAVQNAGDMLGPVSMLIAGMLIAGKTLREVVSNPRVWLVAGLRLLVIPVIVCALFKYSGAASIVPNGSTILMISMLAAITPSASLLVGMAQVYGKDAGYASAINVITTLACIVTIPLFVALYQL